MKSWKFAPWFYVICEFIAICAFIIIKVKKG
jgi:hypothetical protein